MLAPTPEPRCLAAALEYAARGWRVLPIAAGTKRPLTKNGVTDASTLTELIRFWFIRWPDAGVAIACGRGLRILDVDPRNGGDETLRALESVHGAAVGPTVLTAGGGQHVYLEGDGPKRLVGPGLELLGEGGYALAPPSIGPSGAAYAWEATSGLDDMPIVPVPRWLLEAATPGERAAEAGERDAVWSVLGVAFEAAGRLGKRLADGRRAVSCPWAHEHSSGKEYDTSTVLLPPRTGASLGWFHCSHAHCHGRGAREALAALPRDAVAVAEERYPRPEKQAPTSPEQPNHPLEPGKPAASLPILQPLEWPAISAELPSVPWLCKALHIAPGRPVLLSAPPGAGKTWVALSLALAVSSGGRETRALDSVDVQRFGRVVHLNFDYPEAAARRRYQRVAHGLGLAERGIVPDVHLWSRAQLAGFSLVSEGAAARLTAMVTGATLCIIDALRGALPGIDLNDSRVRDYLDVLLEVSDRTGCTFVVIHHDRKAKQDDKSERQDRSGGSHQIVAGADVTLHVEKAGVAWRVIAGKVSEGKADEDGLLVELVDVDAPMAGEDGVSPGVRFLAVGPEEAAQKGVKAEGRQVSERMRALLAEKSEVYEQVYALIRDNPEKVSVLDAAGVLKKRQNLVSALFTELEQGGRLVNLGSKTRPRWKVAES